MLEAGTDLERLGTGIVMPHLENHVKLMLYFVHYSFHWIPFTFSMALDRVSRSVLADTALTCLKRGKSSGPDFWIDQSVEIRGACQHHSGT